MNKIKQFCTISFLCVLIACIGLFSACSSEILTYEDRGDYGYAVQAANTEISGDIEIPSEYNGKPVQYINIHAFENCTKLTSVTISEGIKYIEGYAFKNCTNCEIIIPLSVVDLGIGSFENATGSSITYQGTKAQFLEQVKGYLPPTDIEITCTDGVLPR